MRNKVFIAVTLLAAVILVVFISIRTVGSAARLAKKKAVTAGAPVKAVVKNEADVKKVYAKGNGAINIQVKGSKGSPLNIGVKAFRSDGKDSSVFAASLFSGRTQELSAGTYDIELDTVPSKIYKNIEVKDGKATIRDLGSVTGSINVKALDSKKRNIPAGISLFYPGSKNVVAAGMANSPCEIVGGEYDIEIAITPKQLRKGVKIENGKETIIDLGVVSGSLIVKAVNEAGDELKLAVRVRSKDGYMATGMISGRPSEIGPGTYDVEVMSSPVIIKNDVKITAGEDTVLQVKVPALPEKKANSKK